MSTDQDYCDQKGMEVYGNEYAMHFPAHEWPAARDKKLSPVAKAFLEFVRLNKESILEKHFEWYLKFDKV